MTISDHYPWGTGAVTMWLTVALGAVAALVIAYLMDRSAKKSTKQHPTIPGLTSSHPELGNLGDVGQAGSLHQFLLNLHETYGPIASFWWGPQLTVSLGSPKLFNEIAKFFDRPGVLFQLFEQLVTEHANLFANGEAGHRRHTAYTRCFSHENMINFYNLFYQVTDELLMKWLNAPDSPKDLQTDMFSVAITAISRASFGELFNNEQEVTSYYHHYNTCFRECERQLKEAPPEPGSEREQLFQTSKEAMFDTIRRVMKTRQEFKQDSVDYLLIDVIMESPETDAVKQADALNNFIAGFHTSGLLLTWSLYYLAKHPDVQEKVYKEMCKVLGDNKVTNDNIQDLVYTQQVLNETLRCSVLTPYAARHSDSECKVDGHVIAPKTPIIQATGVVLMDKNLWPNPQRFDPDRFSPACRKAMPAHAFEPFGFAGKRKCPGWRFAMVESNVVLSGLLRSAKVSLVDKSEGYVDKDFGIVTKPKDAIYVTVEKRP